MNRSTSVYKNEFSQVVWTIKLMKQPDLILKI